MGSSIMTTKVRTSQAVPAADIKDLSSGEDS
jgi:hypothetical protein